MSELTAQQKLTQRIEKGNSLVSIGLDSDFEKLPAVVKRSKYPQFEFNKAIIEATHEFACAYKPNIAFYLARGDAGIRELKMTMEFLQSSYPEIFTICDAKVADIGYTNDEYVKGIFDWFGFDAVTLQPYLGREALRPFLDRKDKISIILCKTSNPGSGEFQDLLTEGRQVWSIVAKKVATEWNENNNCMLVVGATYPEEIHQVRHIAKDLTFLVPGVGAQGGDVRVTMEAGVKADGTGLLINAGRSIVYASSGEDFGEAAGKEAKKLMNEINLYR